MDDKETLKRIGLSDNESEIFLILLKLQESLASEIAKKTRISRPHVYDTLNKLLEKGLVSYVIKNNKKYFRAVNPDKLLDFLKEKEQDLVKILPELHGLNKPKKSKPIIEVYEGKEGLKTMLNDIIKTKKELFVFGASDRINQYLPDHIIGRYLDQRKEKKIKAKQIYSEGTSVLQTPFSTFRTIPQQFSSPSATAIYGDKVTTWIWTEIPVVVVIKSKEVAKSYKDHFELMWQMAKK